MLNSAALGEAREIVVRVPPGYAQGGGSYPVLYVTDADWQFPVIAEYVEYLAYWKRIPPMLVVGIVNVERNRDFVPREDPSFPASGQADRFLPFLLDELRSEIDARYGGSELELLFGHSFGGVLALHTLFQAPDAFDAFIAVGASTWVAERVLFEEAESFFAEGGRSEAMIYMSVAEADGGPTVPDGEAFAELWRERAPDSLEWSFQVIPRTNHFTAVIPSLHQALDELFPTWGSRAELAARLEAEGAGAVDAWFDQQHATLGPRFFPPIMELNELAYGLSGQAKFEHARALSRRLRAERPDSPEVFAVAAYIELQAGDSRAALDFVHEAIAVAERVGFFASRTQSYRQLAAKIEAGLAEG